MEYNLLNLSSREFENLSADILTEYLGKTCRTFAEGMDGGIDIRPIDGDDTIIGQCKRHKSPSQATTKILEKSYQIKQKEVKEYYVFVACELTPNDLDKIYNEYKYCMKDQTHIFDGVRICNLLDNDKYQNILKKHFKLWACSEKVISLLQNKSITHDSNTLINNINKHTKYYVETNDSKNVYKKLLENRILLIKGEPGVGKSTISEMTVMKMLANMENINLIYSSYGSINKIKDKMSLNPNMKELIYIDDFLGQIYFDLQQDKISNIIGFIDTIKMYKNKFLLLNTRITVLNEASKQYKRFLNSLEKIGIHQIELKNISRIEKAKILYNHLYFSDIEEENKQIILHNRNYLKIIDHKNYNPRLIEYICKKQNFKIEGGSYLDFILNSLNNPKEIWSEPFKYKLKEIDKLFMLTLYGISDDYVERELHKKAFYELEYLVVDRERLMDNYNECYTRLIDSYITAVYDTTTKKTLVKILNPSISDVLKEYFVILNDSDYKKHLIIYEQYLRAYDSFLQTKRFQKMIENKEIERLYSNGTNIIFPVIAYFVNAKELKNEVRDYYIKVISYKDLGSLAYPYGKSIGECYDIIMRRPIFDFYNVNEVNETQLIQIINNIFYMFETNKIITVLGFFDADRIKNLLIKTNCLEIIIDKLYSNLDIYDIINDIILDNMDKSDDVVENLVLNKVYYEILDSISNDEISNIFENFDFLVTDDIIFSIVSQYNIKKEIDGFIAEARSDYENDDYYNEQYIEKKEEEIEIEKMFKEIA